MQKEDEMIPSQANAYVVMADGTNSRTLGELYRLIPQDHRRKIMGATGPGTSLCAVLEYVARYGEDIKIHATANQQKLIGDLAARSEEAAAYRVVLEKIKTDAHWMSSEHQDADQVLTKYPQ